MRHRPEGDDPDERLRGTDAEVVAHAHETARHMTGVVAGGTFVGLHLVVGALVLTFAGLVRPVVLTGLLVAWVVGAVVGWRGRRQRPIVTMLVPFAVAALAIAVVAVSTTQAG